MKDNACEVMFRGRMFWPGSQPAYAKATAWQPSRSAGLPSRSATGAKAGGARRDRTDDLMLAKHALSQLSYGPVTRRRMLASSRSLRRKFCHARLRPTGLRRARFALLYERGCATRSRRRSVVGLGRLELPTSRLSSARSNQLSYKPLTRGAWICAQPAQAPDASHKR